MSPDPRYFSRAAAVAGFFSIAFVALNWRPNLGWVFLLAGAVERKYPKHRPTVIRVVVGDSVYDSTDGFGDGSCWCAE